MFSTDDDVKIIQIRESIALVFYIHDSDMPSSEGDWEDVKARIISASLSRCGQYLLVRI